jgi:hypothetical protein
VAVYFLSFIYLYKLLHILFLAFSGRTTQEVYQADSNLVVERPPDDDDLSSFNNLERPYCYKTTREDVKEVVTNNNSNIRGTITRTTLRSNEEPYLLEYSE